MEQDNYFSKRLTEDQKTAYKLFNKMTFYPSRFGFLNAHNGIRPSSLHVLLAPTGIGKTTLLQSILSDTCQNTKCLVFCTEEPCREWEAKLLLSNPSTNMDNVIMQHSSAGPTNRTDKGEFYIEHLFTSIMKSEAKVIFLDNLTTDPYYSSAHVNEQGKLINELLKFCKRHEKSIFAIAHTATDFRNRDLLVGANIRYNKIAHNMAEFFYCMQDFPADGRRFIYVKNDKFRGYEIKNTYWHLQYEKGCYNSDKPLPFIALKEAFALRDKL